MEVSIEINYLNMEISNEDTIFKKISEYIKGRSGIDLSSVTYNVKPFTERNYYYFDSYFNEVEKPNEINKIVTMMKTIECEQNSLTKFYAEVAFLMHLLHAIQQTKITKKKKSMHKLFNKSIKFYSTHLECNANAVKTHNNLKFNRDMFVLLSILLAFLVVFLISVILLTFYYQHK